MLALGNPTVNVCPIDEPPDRFARELNEFQLKFIKHFILLYANTAFCCRADFIMATYLAVRVIVFEGTPTQAVAATATLYVFSSNRWK